MSRMIIAALTMAALAACGQGDRGETATADSLSRDLQLAPVDTSAELNDRPTASAPAPAPAARTPARTSRPTTSPSTSSPSAAAPATPAPAATPASLAAGTSLTAATTAEIRSHKNKVGDTVTAKVATDVKIVPAGS